MAVTTTAFALPLGDDATALVSVSARGVLLGLCVVGLAVRILTSRGRQRGGWLLLSVPFVLGPFAPWLTPDDLAGRGDLAGLAIVSLVAQPTTFAAVMLLVPENARSIRAAGWVSLAWPFPLLLGSIWVAGIDPVLTIGDLSTATALLLASSLVLLAVQEVLFLAPTPSRSSVTTSSARLLVLMSLMTGMTALAYNMALPSGGARLGGVTDALGLATLTLVFACVVIHRRPIERSETLAVATRARLIMPVALGAGIALRLTAGAGIGDLIILLGVLAAVSYLGRTLAERETLVRSLSQQATTDALTGLANRSALRAHLDDRVRTNEPTSVIYVDLDEFKMVNDEFGHGAGDELLTTTANRLAGAVPPGGLLARVGGDEFVAVVPRDLHTTMQVAGEMIARLSAAIRLDGATIEPRGSAGVSRLAGDPDRTIDEADMALYAAKSDRTTRIRIFDERMRSAAHQRHRVDVALPALIDQGRLSVAYQPIVGLASGEWVGVEALVRWPHDDDVDAEDIVEACERLRLGNELTTAVLQRAAEDLPALRRLAGVDLFCTVNVALQPDTPDRLPASLAALRRTHPTVRPGDLVLEITERQLPYDFAALADMLGRLRLDGYRVAIDDFGAGYSALAQLSRLSFDFLKLDGAFTDDLPVGLDLIELVVELCHGKGAQVVAEGIEHPRQLAQLQATSCDLGQGYLWLRPHGIDELAAIADLAFHAAGTAPIDQAPLPR